MRMAELRRDASSFNSTPSSSSSSASSSSSSSDPTFFYFSILTNFPLLSALLAFTVAQAIKFFSTRYRDSRWDVKQLVASGGMPSSHSSTVTALAVAIGCQDGFDGSLFAASMILACVVMYDAVGVRLQAGKQAQVLNQIVYELPEGHPLAESIPLRELLGHTPFQVFAGGALGLFIAVTGHLLRVSMG